MKLQRDKIRIEIYPRSDTSEPEEVRVRIANEAVLALARLIGRQMAREQFQKKMALERRSNNARKRSIESYAIANRHHPIPVQALPIGIFSHKY
ncbi:hypothetical protein [Brucella grignonensis]|uniref:Uncharacterized protein n=1 Tax=Brucella grignonensis TaxID=94627 RepID=A0A256FC51_9HYPH|nr:hypothetical protein [Brucella grignonensis]NKB84138.1 hypothetical protein [Brucella grignonensis]OYR12457.1 hypothetical protein CEV33_1241 [Brucella grignonensis]